MPDLPTPQAYLEQSALLLQAYPDSVSRVIPVDPGFETVIGIKE